MKIMSFKNEVKNNAYFNSIFTHNQEGKLDENCMIENLISALNAEDKKVYNKLMKDLNSRYSKHLNKAEYAKYISELKNMKNGFVRSVKEHYHFYSIDEAKHMFELAMNKLIKYANKYNTKLPGFRFAINGGRSVNTRSFSFNTWPFIVRDNNEPMRGIKSFLRHGIGGILWLNGETDVWTKANEIIENEFNSLAA